MGPYEMLVILAIGLMLFSPKELPGVLRGIAKFWGSVRRTADEFRDAIMEDEDLRQPLDELKSAYEGTRNELRKAEDAARSELMKARMEVRAAEQKLAAAARESEASLRDRVASGDDPALGEGEADAPAGDFPVESSEEAQAAGPETEAPPQKPRGPLPPPPPTGRQGAA